MVRRIDVESPVLKRKPTRRTSDIQRRSKSRPQLSGPVKKRSGSGVPQRISGGGTGYTMGPQISPEKPGAGGGGGAAGQSQMVPAQQQPPDPLDVVTSAKQVGGRIGPDNTLRNRRIGFKGAGGDYGAGGLLSSVISGNELDRSDLLKSHFESIIPMMEEERMKRMDSLMGKTAAMGRTGSGMFNTDVGNLELATRRGRDSLLGRLSAQAAGQEIQDRLGAAGQATQLRGQNLQESGMRARHLQSERNYEDRLARQAMSDEARRLGFLQSQMNQYDPRQAMMQHSGTQMQGSGRFGANAAQIGSQLSQGAQAMMQSQGSQGDGGGGILDFVGEALGGGGGPGVWTGGSMPGMDPSAPYAPPGGGTWGGLAAGVPGLG